MTTVLTIAKARHLRVVHEQIKDYACYLCDYKTGHKSHFVRHVKTVHEKRRDYKCHMCDKDFTQNSSLKEHVKSAAKLFDRARFTAFDQRSRCTKESLSL